jgi:parallel beta-helix repeat protein
MLSPFAVATTCCTILTLIKSTWAYPHGTVYHVTSGQSIQAVIDKAHGGDRIIVEAGTYAEQLTISTDGITLEGHNAMIVPPASQVTNTCSNLVPGAQAGICITGSNVVFSTEPFDGEHTKVVSVGRRVKDTSISGFTVTGFSGLNIAVLGAQDAIITENTLSSAAQYGILTVGSKNSNIKHNTVLSTPGYYQFYFIGICMDDVSTVTIAHNDVSGHFIGLCVQTAGADIHDNNVHDVCTGAFVDPGVNGAKLHDNTFSNAIVGCPGFPAPPPSGYYSSGITISGGTNTVVKNNKFFGLKNAGQAMALVLVDDPSGVVAAGNQIEDNTFTNNDLDIYDEATGKGNVVKKNTCTLSTPTTLCS